MIGFISETAVASYQSRHDRLIDEIGERRRAFKAAPTTARMQAVEDLEAALVSLKREALRVGVRVSRYL